MLEGWSGSDIRCLCAAAADRSYDETVEAFGDVRNIPSADAFRAINKTDFTHALSRVSERRVFISVPQQQHLAARSAAEGRSFEAFPSDSAGEAVFFLRRQRGPGDLDARTRGNLVCARKKARQKARAP